MHPSERPPQITATPSTPNSRLPGISRITNSTAARTAALLALLTSTAACSSVEAYGDTVNNDIGCDPVPSCPRPNLAAAGPYGNDFYLSDDRWFRVNPETNEIIVVCDPTERDFCEEGESPALDGCDPPVCPGAQEAMCDPIPSRKDQDSPYVSPEQANIPTSTEYVGPLPFILDDKLRFPVIYDISPDCKAGESPEGDSGYTCDLNPTCETTIPYCRPLERCEPGQPVLSCSESPYKYSNFDDCVEQIYDAEWVLRNYNIDIYPGLENICEEQYDPNINEYYHSPPLFTVNCIPTPECSEGGEPLKTTLSVDIDCGKWGSWTSVDDYAPSCDPIKSCK